MIIILSFLCLTYWNFNLLDNIAQIETHHPRPISDISEFWYDFMFIFVRIVISNDVKETLLNREVFLASI